MVFILLLEEIVKVVVNNFTEHMDRVRQLLEAKVLAGNLELYHQERSLHIVQVNNKSPCMPCPSISPTLFWTVQIALVESKLDP